MILSHLLILMFEYANKKIVRFLIHMHFFMCSLNYIFPPYKDITYFNNKFVIFVRIITLNWKRIITLNWKKFKN